MFGIVINKVAMQSQTIKSYPYPQNSEILRMPANMKSGYNSLFHDDNFNFKSIIVSSFVILSMTNLFIIDLPKNDWHTGGKWLIQVAKYRILIDYGHHLIQDNPCPEKAGHKKLPLPPLVRHMNINYI